MVTDDEVRKVFTDLQLELPEIVPDWARMACAVILGHYPGGKFTLSDAQRAVLGAPGRVEHFAAPHQLSTADFDYIGETSNPGSGARKVKCCSCGAEYYDDARGRERLLPMVCPICKRSHYE